MDLCARDMDAPRAHNPSNLQVSHLSNGQVVSGTETDHEAFAACNVECKESILWVCNWRLDVVRNQSSKVVLPAARTVSPQFVREGVQAAPQRRKSTDTDQSWPRQPADCLGTGSMQHRRRGGMVEAAVRPHLARAASCGVLEMEYQLTLIPGEGCTLHMLSIQLDPMQGLDVATPLVLRSPSRE